MIAPAYDPDNIFAKILRGEMPCHKVYEDDHVLAFMDIMPRTDGHTLVIPKVAGRNLYDLPPEAFGGLFRAVQTVARAIKTAFTADGMTLLQSSEAAAGQVVFHLHVHLMPRRDGVKLRPHSGDMADKDILVAHAARIRAAL